MWTGEVRNARRMNQNQRYECLIGIHRVFMPYGMNRGEYAAKPRQRYKRTVYDTSSLKTNNQPPPTHLS